MELTPTLANSVRSRWGTFGNSIAPYMQPGHIVLFRGIESEGT